MSKLYINYKFYIYIFLQDGKNNIVLCDVSLYIYIYIIYIYNIYIYIYIYTHTHTHTHTPYTIYYIQRANKTPKQKLVEFKSSQVVN